VSFEQAHQLLAGRHGLTGKNAALGLVDQACNQRQIMPDLAAPAIASVMRIRGGSATTRAVPSSRAA
jgi:hypothetical protein